MVQGMKSETNAQELRKVNFIDDDTDEDEKKSN